MNDARDAEDFLSRGYEVPRVIPLGQIIHSQHLGAVTVVAVAIWEREVMVFFSALTMGSLDSPASDLTEWTLTDDRETQYELSGGVGGQSGSAGTGRVLGFVVLTGNVPDSATELRFVHTAADEAAFTVHLT